MEIHGTGPVGPGASGPQQLEHTVRQGETLEGIASQHNVSPESLLRNNSQIKNGQVEPGQVLSIPEDKKQTAIAEKGIAKHAKDVFEPAAKGSGNPAEWGDPHVQLSPAEAKTAKGKAYETLQSQEAKNAGNPTEWGDPHQPRFSPGDAKTDKWKAHEDLTQAKFAKGPGQARTDKGKAYQEMMNAEQSNAPGEARTDKGKAYQKMIHSQEGQEPGKARTAKGQAYQEMIHTQEGHDPGKAKTAKGKAYEELLRREIEGVETKSKK